MSGFINTPAEEKNFKGEYFIEIKKEYKRKVVGMKYQRGDDYFVSEEGIITKIVCHCGGTNLVVVDKMPDNVVNVLKYDDVQVCGSGDVNDSRMNHVPYINLVNYWMNNQFKELSK